MFLILIMLFAIAITIGYIVVAVIRIQENNVSVPADRPRADKVGSVICRWACDDPQCVYPVCDAICDPPVCTYDDDSSPVAGCDVRCPTDMMATQVCPSCEAVCPDAEEGRDFTCAHTNCGWKCDPASSVTCRAPTCELMCESACVAQV